MIRAFADARNAITAQKQAADRVAARSQAVNALRRQVYLATLRYDNGSATYLEVLDAQRELLTAGQQLVQARQALLSSQIALYSALGGGSRGNPELPPPSLP